MAGFGDKSDAQAVPFLNRAPDQTAFVFPDLHAGIERFARLTGATEWAGWDYHADYLPNRMYDGAPSDYRSLAAVPKYGPRIEIIQPLVGPSVFTTFLDVRPEGGLHHLGWFVPSLDEVRAHFAPLGVTEIMGGWGHGVRGDGAFCYFDTFAELGCYLEFIEVPEERYPPHFDVKIDL